MFFPSPWLFMGHVWVCPLTQKCSLRVWYTSWTSMSTTLETEVRQETFQPISDSCCRIYVLYDRYIQESVVLLYKISKNVGKPVEVRESFCTGFYACVLFLVWTVPELVLWTTVQTYSQVPLYQVCYVLWLPVCSYMYMYCICICIWINV